MNLITIKNNSISAYELYNKLFEKQEKKTAFNIWIGRRIKDYGFIEFEDFHSFLIESKGGRPMTDYAISFDMAKELCMVEKTEISRSIRKYFIECEKKLKNILIRDSGKLTRRNLTDIIKDSGLNEKMHGFAYSNFTKLVYKKLGIDFIKTRNFRDTLNDTQLKAIENLEKIVEGYLRLGYDYHAIKNCIPEIILIKENKLAELKNAI